MPQRLLLPRSQTLGLDGRPIAGAKLYTYETGTSTPKAVFTDAGLSVAHANPVEADAAGRFPAMFAAPGEYRTVLADAADAVIATDDPVEGSGSLTGTTLAGPLSLSYANPVATVNKAASGQTARFNGATAGALRWSIVLGDSTAEVGANAGSRFLLQGYDDAGALLSTPLTITRAGEITVGGNTTISKANPAFALNKIADGESAAVFGQRGGLLRWVVLLGGTATESGANAGSNFDVGRYSDAGAFIDLPLSINRSTGIALFSQRPQLAGTGLGVNLSATTALSGNAVDIGGIPSNARRVTVGLDFVSTNGTSDLLIQLGDAGGIETTGYQTVHAAINTSTASGTTRTTGWSFDTTAATNVFCGTLTLILTDSATNTWVGQGVGGNTEIVSVSQCAGRKPLSQPLTSIRITTAGGTDTFDAGIATIAWEV